MKKKILIIVLLVIIALFGIWFFMPIITGDFPPDIDPEPSGKSTENKPFVNPPYFSEPMEKNSKVTSPLTVKGVVPYGWMFEGNVPVKLLDENRNVIAQAPGSEVYPGTWMDDVSDEFTATLTFTTTAKSGYLVVSKDNPSGLPENDDSYEIPVRF